MFFSQYVLSTETSSSSRSLRASLHPLKNLSQPEFFVAAEQTHLVGYCFQPPKQFCAATVCFWAPKHNCRARVSELLCSPTRNFPSQGLFVVAETNSARSLFSASETNSPGHNLFLAVETSGQIHLVGMYELVFSPPPPLPLYIFICLVCANECALVYL